MTANATVVAPAIAEFVRSQVVITADEVKTPLRNLVPETMVSGGDSYKWNVQSALNASTTQLADGADAPTAGNGTYGRASIAYATALYGTTIKVTKSAITYAMNGHFDPLEQEINTGVAAHLGTVEDGLITDLEAAVGSAGDYAGLTRATYNLASQEALVAGALALSNLYTQDLALRSTPINADVGRHIILSDVNRRQEYLDVAVGTGAGDARITYAKDNSVDAGTTQASTSFNGKPWYDISRMTSGTVIEINPNNMVRAVVRGLETEQLGLKGDYYEFFVTSQERLIVPSPREAAKITSS